MSVLLSVVAGVAGPRVGDVGERSEVGGTERGDVAPFGVLVGGAAGLVAVRVAAGGAAQNALVVGRGFSS